MLTLLQPSLLHRHSRRKGQALILAVLVMLFAVLLSSAFLVVIGNSGRQVTRETERSEASRNADKGVAFAIAQLRAAPNPDAWNPANTATAIPANAAEEELYYSQLDKAMGWNTQRFVKYPNPLTSRQAPQFMVSSHLMGTAAADDADGGDKRFMLRITVIGLSTKNPEAWSRRILYKTTNWNGGTFSYANFVTAFDPDTQKPIVSALAAVANAAPALGSDVPITIFASKGQGNERVTYSPRIAEVGNTLMISDGVHRPLVGVVKSSTLVSPTYNVTLRVLQAGTAAGDFALNSKVALVGSLFELPAQIDENGDGNGVPANTTEGITTEQQIISVRNAGNTNAVPFGNGAQFNNGLNVPLTTTFAARPPELRTYPGGKTYAGQNALSSSGPISIGDPTPIPAGTPTGINVVAAVAGPAPTFVPQVPSNENQFLRVGFSDTGAPEVITANSVVSPVVAPRTVKPAQINFASYRTRAIASGLYLNNADDVEKFNGQPLTTSQLHRLWQRKSFPVTTGGNVTPVTLAAGTTGARLCYGRPGVDAYVYPMASGGLEARGIRGWISPWEFLPRGVQIIFNPAVGVTPASITIISDPLSDNSSNAPDLTKAFPAGTRQFSQSLPANFTGIIAAEGNVRVRGNWSGAPLTIVSNNNIYIEGNLRTRDATTGDLLPGRVALLAKKDVVLNPTQFVARPIGTVDTSVGMNSLTAQVNNGRIVEAAGKTVSAEIFKIGDRVAVFKQGLKFDGWREVVGFDDVANPTSIQLNPALDTTNYPNSTDIKVKLACDPPIVLLAKANKVVGTGPNDIPATEHFVPTGTEEANIQEYTPATLPTGATGVHWAYKFAFGGDTLARNVPFGGNIGVAMNHTAAKSNIKFYVKAGEDYDPADPGRDINKKDNGQRHLSVRTDTTFPISLDLAPEPGEINKTKVFDLQAIMVGGSPSTGDSQSHLLALNQFFRDTAPDADLKKTRWRIENVDDPAANDPTARNIPGRRLAKADIPLFTLTEAQQADEEDTTPLTNPPTDKRTKFRVPLTSSVLLFNNDLSPLDPTTLNPLFTIGSAFGYQAGALPTTPGLVEDTNPDINRNTTNVAFYGSEPEWNIANSTSTNGTVTYAQRGPNGTFAFTRDGAGDFDDRLPVYYLSGTRFQKVDPATGSSAIVGPTSTSPYTEPQKVNLAVEVDATIYAEGGSWFVIPTPATVASNAGLGTSQQIEWRRPAYAITINGNIAQMMTPTATVDYDDEPDADGVATGAMKRWTDTLSYQVDGGTWKTINYKAVPLPAFATDGTGTVILDPLGRPVTAPLPQLPASSDILYTYTN